MFEKTGRARYISHLDLMRTLRRVFARAGVALRHTEGFNPHPRMSLALPLPVGQESVCELMDFETEDELSYEAIPELLNPKMPEGIRARMAYAPARPASEIKWIEVYFALEYGLDAPANAAAALVDYFSAESIIVPKRTKRGTRDIDIIPAIASIVFSAPAPDFVAAVAVVSADSPSLNPDMLIAAISRDAPELAPDYALIRRAELFDEKMKVFR
jgi:radical SAM-linked protein